MYPPIFRQAKVESVPPCVGNIAILEAAGAVKKHSKNQKSSVGEWESLSEEGVELSEEEIDRE